MEQKFQLEQLPKLGIPDTRKVNLTAEQERVIKNKGRLFNTLASMKL